MGKEVENDQREAWEWGLLPRPGATKGGSGFGYHGAISVRALPEDAAVGIATGVPDN